MSKLPDRVFPGLPEIVGHMCLGKIPSLGELKFDGFVCCHVPIVRMEKHTMTINLRTGEVIPLGEPEIVAAPLPSHAIHPSKN